MSEAELFTPVVAQGHAARAAATPIDGLGAALAAAALLSACGGGDGLPEGFARSAEAPMRRSILGADSASAAADGCGLVPTATELMDWAELHYAQYFAPHQTDKTEAPYTYRLYASTGNAVGVANGTVYILGPIAGSNTVPVAVGKLADFASKVFASRYAYSDAQAARFLQQATLGATDADIAAVRSLGYESWLTQQLALPVSTSNWDWLVSKGIDVDPNARAMRGTSDNSTYLRLRRKGSEVQHEQRSRVAGGGGG